MQRIMAMDRGRQLMRLRTLVVITDADGTVFAQTMGPEAFNVGGAGLVRRIVQDGMDDLPGHGVMSEEEPESENGLGENVKNGIGDDLGVDVGDAGTISDTPDAVECQRDPMLVEQGGSHWVDSPEDEGETCNGAEEGGGLGVFALDNATAVVCELVDNDQVGNARDCVPAPLWALLDGEGGEETGQDHDDVSDNSDEDVGTIKTSQQAQIHQ